MARLIDRVQIFNDKPIQVFFYETIEINGETKLIGSLTEFISGINYHEPFAWEDLQSELDADSPTPIPIKPNWAGFTSQIFQTEIYQTLRETSSNQKTWVTLENLSVSSAVSGNDLGVDGYQLLAIQWNLLVNGSSSPTPEQITQLNAIATSTNMKFSFDENCLMILT